MIEGQKTEDQVPDVLIEDAIEASNNKVSSLIQLYNELGQKDLDMGRYEEAIDFFDKVIEKDKNDLTAWEGKGIAFNYLQRYEEAAKSFQNAINVVEERKKRKNVSTLFANLWYQKGLSLLNLKKYEEWR